MKSSQSVGVKAILLLGGLLIILAWIGQFVFAFMFLSFIPSDWLVAIRFPLSLTLTAATVFVLFVISKLQPPNADAEHVSPPSMAVTVFGVVFAFIVYTDFVLLGLPWAYTKIVGERYNATYSVEQLGYQDAKFCIKVNLEAVDRARICAQKIFPSGPPKKGDQVVLFGKLSPLGFLVQESRTFEQ
jgi:hypothetical protein